MSTRHRSAIIHGHFYQPPREDPWLEEVPREASAAPFHDWNERIEHECYRAVAAARIPTASGKIARIVNTLECLSFDFGPTLLEWLEWAAPDTYASVLEADRLSCAARDGHGNAMAMPYHHVILPLASRRDKTTEVRWGIEDFRLRFGRPPEGMWLPETAVDDETLDVLAQEGITFTVLAPHQVREVPSHGLPASYRTANGRSITVFVYDGSISHDVAFGGLIRDSTAWHKRMLVERGRRLVAVATDGETYGHHHAFGEMALAAVLLALRKGRRARVENFASFLARQPPAHEVELHAPSSWSCSHGVERWRSECGCKMHPERHTQQQWRAVLRNSLEWLASELHRVFERDGVTIFGDPWKTRDAYGRAVTRGGPATLEFVRSLAITDDDPTRRRAAELLEMERNALRMFTSCGWFFDDIGGLESRQVLRYAARAIELSGREASELREAVRRQLAAAVSNDAAVGTGQDIFDAALPTRPPPVLVAAACRAVSDVTPATSAALPRAFAATATSETVSVRCLRTGTLDTFETVLARDAHEGVVVAVRAPGADTPQHVSLRELPERSREAIARTLRGEILQHSFPEDARTAVAAGEPVERVATDTLEGAVRSLAEDVSPGGVQRVMDLLTFFDLLGVPFPFDAQTTFYRVWQGAARKHTTLLAPLANRFGFE